MWLRSQTRTRFWCIRFLKSDKISKETCFTFRIVILSLRRKKRKEKKRPKWEKRSRRLRLIPVSAFMTRGRIDLRRSPSINRAFEVHILEFVSPAWRLSGRSCRTWPRLRPKQMHDLRMWHQGVDLMELFSRSDQASRLKKIGHGPTEHDRLTLCAWMMLGAVKKAGMENHVSYFLLLFFFPGWTTNPGQFFPLTGQTSDTQECKHLQSRISLDTAFVPKVWKDVKPDFCHINVASYHCQMNVYCIL